MKPYVLKAIASGSIALVFFIVFEIIILSFFTDIQPLLHAQLSSGFVLVLTLLSAFFIFRKEDEYRLQNQSLMEKSAQLEGELRDLEGRIEKAQEESREGKNERNGLVEEIRAGRERLREVSRQLVLVQEQERRFLSRELHDEAGQALTALAISLRLIQSDMEVTEEPPEVVQRLCEAIELTEITMAQLRTLAQNLRPPSMDTLGLTAALDGFCRDFARRSNLEITVRSEEISALSETHSITLYRFLQEALTNVAKHAQATKVWVNLYPEDQAICLSVEDDGIGLSRFSGVEDQSIFDPKDPRLGLGLIGMRERFEMLGGYVRILSQKGKGVCLVGYLPAGEGHLERRKPDGSGTYRR